MTAPSAAWNASIAVSGGFGEADLYVRLGLETTDGRRDCRPYLNGNNGSASVSNPTADGRHMGSKPATPAPV